MDGVPAVCGIRGPMSGVPPSEDDLAADWGAALEQEAAAMAAGPDGDTKSGAQTAADAGANPARLLSQSEIDSLLGFDGGPAHGGERSGIQRILEVGLVAYERLPMLEIVVDRLVRLLSTTLRNFTSDNVEVSVDSITSLRFSDYMDSVPLPAMLAVFRVEQWDNYGLVVADSALIYSVVDVLLGGRRGIAPMRVEGRPYTTIERTLIERLLGVVLGDLGTAFEPLAPATFRFERLEVNPRFAAISRPSNACVLVKLRLDMEDRGGRLELLLPPRRWSRCASCCCRASWARGSAATRSGKRTSPKSCATPRSGSMWCWTSKPCRSGPCCR